MSNVLKSSPNGLSSIGSTPKMASLNIYEQVKLSVDYLKTRIRQKGERSTFQAQEAEHIYFKHES